MSIIVDRLSLEHYKDFLAVFSEIELLHRVAVPHKFKKPENELFDKSYFQLLIEDEKSQVCWAFLDGVLVWYCIAFVRSAPVVPVLVQRTWIEIDSIAVLKKQRGKWIGTMLHEYVEQYAKRVWIQQLELNVYVFNSSAQQFYTQRWYSEISKTMIKHL